MRRFVFAPRWMLGHLLVVVAVVSCVLLGRWQLDRAHVTESVQNWGYALQWPLFAVFFAVMWWRMLCLESRRLDEVDALDRPVSPPMPVAEPPTPVAAAPAAELHPPPEASEDDEEPGLAAYNRMLAALAAEEEARERS